MSESFQPSARFHRVTTRRRTLHALQCPLEPELLVAEFAGELPPDVALAVREHIAVCETCGARSQALRTPYQVLASLGEEPVPHVPDLRDSVRAHLAHGRTSRRILSMLGALGRGGGLATVGVLIAVALVGFLIFGLISANAQNLNPSTNQYTGVSAAAAHGTLFAETDKLATVKAANGQQWQVAEVIAVNEQSGTVLHSLPTSTDALHPSRPSQLPVATSVSADGHTIYEVTAPNGHHQQALVAFDASSGNLRFATVITLPNQQALPAGSAADALTIAPDGSLAYVGLSMAQAGTGGIRVLVFDAQSGTFVSTLSPNFLSTKIPEPPPPGSLPISVFPKLVPHLNATGLDVSLGAHGNIVISPDGKWLYDELLLSQNGKVQYGVVRRFNAQTGGTAVELAIGGDFSISQLAIIKADGIQPQLYLVKGSPNATAYVLTTSGPIQTGLIALGGPTPPTGVAFNGNMTIGVTDGTHLYVTQSVSTADGSVTGRDLWLLDTQGMSVQAQLLDSDAANQVLANPAQNYTAGPFLLRGGEVLLAPNSLNGSLVPWLSLSDGHPIIALLAAV